MNSNGWNRLCPVLWTAALVAGVVGAVVWLMLPAPAAMARNNSAQAVTLPISQPDASSAHDSLNVTAAVSPTSQIRSPNANAWITEKESLTISGIAWSAGSQPPYLTDDPVLGVDKITSTSYNVHWTDVISAQGYILQEATTADFETYTEFPLDALTTDKTFTKSAGDDGTYYYRVLAYRSGFNPSRWSNVVLVSIPWTAFTTALSSAVPAVGIGTSATGTLTVEVRIDGGTWQTAVVTSTEWGCNWTYTWSPLPEERGVAHTLETRATDDTGSGPVDSISVTLDNQRFIVFLPMVSRRWPPVPYAPTLNAIDNSDNNGDYAVSWSYSSGSSSIVANTYTLQESTDSGFTAPYTFPTISEPQRTVSIVSKAPGVYYYRVRGNNSYGPGEWSAVQSVTVPPGVPVLNAINNSSHAPSYTVSWSSGSGAQSYELQEATASDFSNAQVVYNSTGLSVGLSGRATGTYYYRVRSVAGSAYSNWSNVVSTQVVGGFYDDFSNANTGWPQTTYNRGTSPDGQVMDVRYVDGTYRMKILLETSGLNNKRMGVVASPYVNSLTNYDVEVDHRFVRASDQGSVDPTWGKGGLIFAANDNYSTIYAVEWHFPDGSNQPQCAVYKYNQVTLPTTIVWLAGGTPLRAWGTCAGLQGGYDRNNTVRAEVRGNQVTVYINGTWTGTFSDADLGNMHRVGLMTGSWERTPVESRFDNFRVTPK